MSNAAISKTLKACIVEAYKIQKRAPPHGLTAHSIRGMATNVAFTHSASPLEVCRAATWSSLSTFTRHYKMNAHSAQEGAAARNGVVSCSHPGPIIALGGPALQMSSDSVGELPLDTHQRWSFSTE